ncbi:MAG: carbohydrate kinase [Alphaproteobacteria bacterium]|jgi:L-xylulokinase|nr:carbohydrate kinase [Alphaproteobacteria bacterium]MBT4018613.1 carbohydrate kinase [Alphaproteobacteria bacterium]MBT5158385.1 carbohydrate kinase [Alphaproteobacteria bacterium]MBT5916929.1 carbohydrate kinase [Alphaproteobacteria bacterium]MBT6385888.1 carbohydrate kinase [Alphaproteobacteria bacterium]
MGSYLLGLDAGNTVTKAVLFDTEGQQIAAHACPGVSWYPKPGYVERSLPDLWQQASEAIKTCIAQSNIDPAQILGVGCSGHGNGLYLLDKQKAPLLGIQSLDSRAIETVSDFTADGRAGKIYDICLQKPWPSQTATLLAWIKKHDPDIFERIGTAFLCKDYLAFRLTGNIASDYSDMSGCGLLRLPELEYDPELLALYGLEDCRDMLPPLNDSTNVVGEITPEAATITGLIAGTPMVGGLFDIVASALGAGSTSLDQASIVAGTWSINQVVVNRPVKDPSIFMAVAMSKGRFIEVEASATSATNLAWMVQEFLGKTETPMEEEAVFAHCNDLVSSVELNKGLPIFHPFIYGSGDNSSARAGFYGVGGWHTRAHMIHAIYEGVAFGHLQHIQKLRKAGVSFDSASLAGGAARSPVWPQMFADILNVEITVSDCDETGAKGAAIAAGVGLSIFPDLSAGAAVMSKPDRRYTPNLDNQTTYQQRYEIFSELCAVMEPVWDKLSN